MPCVIHPSVTQVAFVFNRPYCARCRANIQAAVALLDAHVTPRDCFVWYAGGQDGWTPIAGTGCAHYVAHQLGIQLGGGRGLLPCWLQLQGFQCDYRTPSVGTAKPWFHRRRERSLRSEVEPSGELELEGGGLEIRHDCQGRYESWQRRPMGRAAEVRTTGVGVLVIAPKLRIRLLGPRECVADESVLAHAVVTKDQETTVGRAIATTAVSQPSLLPRCFIAYQTVGLRWRVPSGAGIPARAFGTAYVGVRCTCAALRPQLATQHAFARTKRLAVRTVHARWHCLTLTRELHGAGTTRGRHVDALIAEHPKVVPRDFGLAGVP